MEPAAAAPAGDPGDLISLMLPTDVLQRIINCAPYYTLSNIRLASKNFLVLSNTRVKQLHIKPTNTQIQSTRLTTAACPPSSLQHDHITGINISLPDDLTHAASPTSPARRCVVQQRLECMDAVTQFLGRHGPSMQHLSTLTLSASPKTHLLLLAPLSLPGWAGLRHITLTLTPAEGARLSRKAKELAEEASSLLRMLSKIPALQSLSLCGTSSDCAQISTIFSQLTSLTLSEQASGKAQLSLPHLRKLKLSAQPLSPSIHKYPYRNLTTLQHLALRYCSPSSPDSEAQEAALVDSLSQLRGLTQLQISEKRRFMERTVEPLEWKGMTPALCSMTGLRRLSFLEWTIDDTCLSRIAAACCQLTHLGCLSIESCGNYAPTQSMCSSSSSGFASSPVLSSLKELVFGELDLASGHVPHMQRLAPGLTALTLHSGLQLGNALPMFLTDVCTNGTLVSLALQSHCFNKEVALACRAVARIELGFIWEAACDDSEEDWGDTGGADPYGFDQAAFFDETGEYDVDAMYDYANEMAGMQAISNFGAMCDPDYARSANDVANGVHALAKGKDNVQQLPLLAQQPVVPRILELRTFGGMDDSTQQMEERSLVRMLRVLWRTGWKGEPGMTLVVRGLSDEDDCHEVVGLLKGIFDGLPDCRQWAAVEFVECQGLRQGHITDLAESPGAERGLGIPICVRGCSGVSERECDVAMSSVVPPRVWGRFSIEWEAEKVVESW